MADTPQKPNANPALPWTVGHSGNGTVATRNEVASFCRRLISNDQYRLNLEQRLIRGNAPPAIEALVWHYAVGKPAENVNLNVNDQREDLSTLSTSELHKRLESLKEKLEEAEQVEQTINATYTVQ